MANIKSSRKPTKFYTPTRKKLIILVAIILVAGGVLFVLEKKKVTNLIVLKDPAATDDSAKTTSTTQTAQEDYTDGNERPVNNNPKDEGTVTDTGGTATNTPQSEWTVSADGSITAYAPAKNSILKSGDLLSGASSYGSVSFRLIDDVSGVIADGVLKTKDGKFSGTFNFSTSAATGRIDLFYANPDGTEKSNVEIPIRFR